MHAEGRAGVAAAASGGDVGRAGWERGLVIMNPRAGSARDEAWREALDRLPRMEVRRATRPGEAREAARDAVAAGVDLVVAAGGDGTVNEVLNGLAADFGRARLGVLPLGTANDFARSIGVPADPEAAVEVLAACGTRRIDVARASGPEERFFLNVSVGGFGGRVADRVDEDRKRAWGPLAYFRTAAEELPELGPHRIAARLDGEEMELDAYHVAVANGRRAGGNIPVAPGARLDDGLLDVVLIPVLDVPALLLLLPKVLLGEHLEDEAVIARRAARVEIRSDPPMRFDVDGEPLGEDPVRFEVLPGALRVVCGEGSATAPSGGEGGETP